MFKTCIKRTVFLFILSVLPVFIFSMELPLVPDWYAVYPGNPICPIQKTSFGFALLTDSKEFILCNENGSMKYRGKLKFKPVSFCVGISDFIYIISQNSEVHVFNPSGREISKVSLNAILEGSIVENPLCLDDGSIVLRTQNAIYCLNIKGCLKWKKIMEDQNISIPLQKSDAIYKDSILVTRYSDEVSKLSLLTTFGLLKDICEFPFKIEKLINFDGSFYVLDSSGKIFGGTNEVLRTSIEYCKSNGETPENAEYFTGNDKQLVVLCKNRIFSTDVTEEKGETSFRIKEFYTYNTASKKSNRIDVSKAIVLDDYVIFSNDDWSINAYKLEFPSNGSTTLVSEESSINSLGRQIITDEIVIHNSVQKIDELYVCMKSKKNDFEEFYSKPEHFLSLDFHANDFHKFYNSKSSNLDNEILMEKSSQAMKFLDILSTLGVLEYGYLFRDCLLLESNFENINKILIYASRLKYDDGTFLNSIGNFTRKSQIINNPLLAEKIFDAVYEICVYMGSPVFVTKGKEIISTFLTGNYNSDIKQLARKSYQRMMDTMQ